MPEYPRLLQRFQAARDYGARAGFPRLLDVAFGIGDDAGTRGRQFAYCGPAKRPGAVAVVLAPRLEHEPVDRIDGVIRHEIGHAVDALYSIRSIERRIGGDLEALPPEGRADEIAYLIWGEPIRYDKYDVQSTKRGTPGRPAHLPR